MLLRVRGLILWVLVCAPMPVCAQGELRVRDLGVDELMELGVQASLAVKSSQVEAGIAGDELRGRRSAQLPGLAVGLSAGYVGDPTLFGSGLQRPMELAAPDWSQNYGVELTQPIYAGGGLKLAVDKARLQRQVAEVAVERDVAQVKLLLVGKYLELLRSYSQRVVINQSIAQAEQRLHDIQGMERNGMVTASDVLRSEMQLSGYRLSLLEVENNIVIISNEIDIALGLDEELVLRPDSRMLELRDTLMPYEDYVESAYRKYPELMIAETYVEMAGKDVRIARSDYVPRIAFRASTALSRPFSVGGSVRDQYGNNWSAGLSISYNLSSIYQNRDRVRAACRGVELQSLGQQQLMQDIRSGVKNCYVRHCQALDRINSLEVTARQADENYRIVLNKYLARVAILTDLLDAGTLQLDAQLQLTTARTTALLTYYQLMRASGNL